MDAAALCQLHKLRRQLPAKDRMSILTEAEQIVNGPRQESYGHPLDNWTRTANMVSALLAHKLKAPLTAEDMVQAMIEVKQARQIHRPSHDNEVDIAGYAALLQMIADERQRRATLEQSTGSQCSTCKNWHRKNDDHGFCGRTGTRSGPINVCAYFDR